MRPTTLNLRNQFGDLDPTFSLVIAGFFAAGILALALPRTAVTDVYE